MSAEIIEFKRPEIEIPHASGEAICGNCREEWVAVVPVCNLEDSEGYLECPKCGTMKGRMKYMFRPPVGSMVLTCRCGGELFVMMLNSALCPNCGFKHEYP